MTKRKHYDEKFIEDAIVYRNTHKDLSHKQCYQNLGVGESTLYKRIARATKGGAVVDSGNYSDPKDAEIAKLKRGLKNSNDALEILKSSLSLTLIVSQMWLTIFIFVLDII